MKPFPFFGQGDASYYEWFETWIWFRDPVPVAKRKALLKIAPKLCALDAQWPHPTLLWSSTGDQWIQQHLIETYGTKKTIAKMRKVLAKLEASGETYPDDDDDLDATIAGAAETTAFNADIEKWVLAMNEICPIRFVARREDGEAGGTRLGAWHKKSVAAFESDVLPFFQQLAKEGLAKKKDDLRRAPISIVIEYVGAKKVKPAIRKLGERDSGDA